jgi:ribosomal peptide maturation radical SAM protein 1
MDLRQGVAIEGSELSSAAISRTVTVTPPDRHINMIRASSSARRAVPLLSGGRDRSIERARLLVVVPPFANPDSPSIGAHIISRVAVDCGFAAEVVYANLSFAAELGVREYSRLCSVSTSTLFGERMFSPAFYGEAASSELHEEAARHLQTIFRNEAATLAALQARATAWADRYAAQLAATSAEIIGFTSTFEQTLACLALIERIKRLSPEKTLILGGANVEGAMADTVATLSDCLDHVFSGESEKSFATFLEAYARGEPSPRIVRGSVNRALDELPAPDYSSYIHQLGRTVSADCLEDGLGPDELWLPYESSRGCWWGAKHHCTFCGLNALGIGYREKSPGKVLQEITGLARRHGGSIMMVDNIMPYSYFTTLIPELARRDDGLHIFYEQKANISFERMRLLARAGVSRIQPGIEALDTSLLKLMRKGSTVRTNLECLRFGRIFGISMAWNLLVDFPNDEDAAYEATAALIPLLFHLEPPSAASPLSIERFSPYFDQSDEFGVKNVRPVPAYAAAFPTLEDASGLAYHFQADYPSTMRRRPDLIAGIDQSVEAWKAAWADAKTIPILEVFEASRERYLICDTRPGSKTRAEFITPARARICLTGAGEGDDAEWAVARGYVWRADGQLLPLALANHDCMLSFIGPQSTNRPHPVSPIPRRLAAAASPPAR